MSEAADPATGQTPTAWRELPPALLAQAHLGQYPEGHLLFRRGDRPSLMHLVLDGEAVMERSSSAGATVVLQSARSGQVLAEASLTSARYHCDGRCRTPCRLWLLPVVALRRAIDEEPRARWAWIGLLSQQARQQRLRTERLALKPIRDRLRHLLLTEGNGDGELSWPGTRMALAAELAVTHEALYRALARLAAAGDLVVERDRLRWAGD